MRRPLMMANWKMNKTIPEAIRTVTELKAMISGKLECDVVIAPSFTALNSVSIALQNTNLKLGAQNVSWETEGAFTGEISVKMLSDIGCEYAIIGHSERRQYFVESNEKINQKIKVVLEENIVPVLCIGETLAEREQDKTEFILEFQLKEGLKGFKSNDITSLVLAYEPVWAIGTGKVATPEMAQKAHKYIRNKLSELFGGVIADKIKILYGGSVKPDNVKGLMAQPDIDGALVGGASLDAESFAKIVQFNELQE